MLYDETKTKLHIDTVLNSFEPLVQSGLTIADVKLLIRAYTGLLAILCAADEEFVPYTVSIFRKALAANLVDEVITMPNPDSFKST